MIKAAEKLNKKISKIQCTGWHYEDGHKVFEFENIKYICTDCRLNSGIGYLTIDGKKRLFVSCDNSLKPIPQKCDKKIKNYQS